MKTTYRAWTTSHLFEQGAHGCAMCGLGSNNKLHKGARVVASIPRGDGARSHAEAAGDPRAPWAAAPKAMLRKKVQGDLAEEVRARHETGAATVLAGNVTPPPGGWKLERVPFVQLSLAPNEVEALTSLAAKLKTATKHQKKTTKRA